MRQTRSTVRIVTFVVAALAVLGITAATWASRANDYRRQLENTYQQAVEDLAQSVQSLNTTLLKQQYAGTPAQMEKLATKLCQEASAAKQSLSLLPAGEEPIAGTYKLLSQVGEYSLSLAKKAARGEEPTAEEIEALGKLQDYCEELNGKLYELGQDVLSGMVGFEKVKSTLENQGGAQELSTLADGFLDFESQMNDYPTLIYDGPFSDHLLERDPRMTTGKETVTQDAAKAKAAKALGVASTELTPSGDEEGSMPTYGFSAGDAFVSVTKQGGYLCSMLNSRVVGSQTLSVEKGRQLAREYLTKMEIKSMRESYYEATGGVLTVNFAYEQNDVTVYPDLIKVNVALDTGEIVGFDARGYLVNHEERAIPSPTLTLERAKESVSQTLTITQSRRAVIPSDGLSEISCYEFLCEDQEGQQVLVYVNAATGEEEEILLLFISEDGVLTI